LGQKRVFETVVCPATRQNPRNSEADIIELRDGRLLLAYTDFYNYSLHDMSPARISGKTSADFGKTWSEPFTIQENIGTESVMESDLLRLKSGEIVLFFCCKNSEADCKPYMRKSFDEGKSWSELLAIAKFHSGYFTVNNDRAVQLSSGRLLLPSATTINAWAFNEFVSVCFFSDDNGRTWFRSKDCVSLPNSLGGAQEPGVVELKDGRILMWLRSSFGFMYRSYSEDGGETWGSPESMNVVSPRSAQNIKRDPSTGNLVLVWNNTTGSRRNPLTMAVSRDEGETWKNVKNIEIDDRFSYSYPSLTFIKDLILLTYYVEDEKDLLVHLKLKAIPVDWLYKK
jgi:Neuraminidase (sialidase)